jgi:hypothetical protein
MTYCDGEHRTQHHRGRWHGFGPVRDEETVLFAVFETTVRDGDRLQENSFSHKNLVRCSESLARSSFVTKHIFVRDIGREGKSDKGALIGFCQIGVAHTRELCALITQGHTSERVRAWCIEDKVEEGDCEGHATLGYAEAMEQFGFNPATIGRLRKRIRLDLAKEFSPVVQIESHAWPSRAVLTLARLWSIARAIRDSFSNIFPTTPGPVAGSVGIEGGVVSGVNQPRITWR